MGYIAKQKYKNTTYYFLAESFKSDGVWKRRTLELYGKTQPTKSKEELTILFTFKKQADEENKIKNLPKSKEAKKCLKNLIPKIKEIKPTTQINLLLQLKKKLAEIESENNNYGMAYGVVDNYPDRGSGRKPTPTELQEGNQFYLKNQLGIC